MRAQELLVKETLEEVGGFVSGCAHERWDVNLVIILATIVDLRGFFRRGARLAIYDRQKFSDILNLVKSFGCRDRTARTFDRSSEFDKHQTVETKIAETRIDRDFRSLTVRDGRNRFQQPKRIGVCRLLHTTTAS